MSRARDKANSTVSNFASTGIDDNADANAITIDSSENVGIGTTSPNELLHLNANNPEFTMQAATDGGECAIYFKDDDGNKDGRITYRTDYSGQTDNFMSFFTNSSERLRIDSGGNVLVNQSSTSSPGFSNTTTGLAFSDSGRVFSSASGAASSFNRNTSDGQIVDLRKGGSLIGQLKVVSSDNLAIDCTSTNHSGLEFSTNELVPRRDGAQSDNTINVGAATVRFDNIYATNGTIQTSDQNEKQDIASLTTAEMTAAKAISKLFKTFKWQDKVAAKGDAARTHSGVIAQEVQAAMTDAGLDASNYAFWCSNTWWETSTEVAAVEADEEAGIEAQDAYTRIDTYHTADEAPEGATQRTRMGIRYPELLAFIGASTEQRLADIETRVAALEA